MLCNKLVTGHLHVAVIHLWLQVFTSMQCRQRQLAMLCPVPTRTLVLSLQVPYETLNKKFRNCQKTIDREVSHVLQVNRHDVCRQTRRTTPGSQMLVASCSTPCYLCDTCAETFRELGLDHSQRHLFIFRVCPTRCLITPSHQNPPKFLRAVFGG